MIPSGPVDASSPGSEKAETPVLATGLVWGFDFADGRVRPTAAADLVFPRQEEGPAEAFRWLHINSANQASRRWIEEQAELPDGVRELLLSPETHQRALVENGFVACVLHDFEVDFGAEETTRTGALHLALGPHAMLSARHHPLAAADVVKRRVEAGACPVTPAQSFDLVVSAIIQVAARRATSLARSVQAIEDRLLNDGWEPDPQALSALRREAVRLNRQLSGIRAVLQRLEEDEDLPDTLLPSVEKLNQRVAALHGDVAAAQADIRLLREEIDLQMTQRTNRNLYVLSILSALLLPATLVTGFFGMNTGNMLWSHSEHGTLFAGIAVAGSAASIYLWLRFKGFLGGS
jgi:zinc transporter